MANVSTTVKFRRSTLIGLKRIQARQMLASPEGESESIADLIDRLVREENQRLEQQEQQPKASEK